MPVRTPVAATVSPQPRSSTVTVTHLPAAQAGSRWRVLIVDPHPSIREMIRMILDGYSALIEVVGEASDRERAVELAKEIPIDLVLVDTHLPNGVDATRQIRNIMPHVVILGM